MTHNSGWHGRYFYIIAYKPANQIIIIQIVTNNGHIRLINLACMANGQHPLCHNQSCKWGGLNHEGNRLNLATHMHSNRLI